ncbi:hypothetical protein [Azospirillum sp.]|uniref:hypothetical protein n=1 Tax=Azospirillum sp. TaxID=34012 RepID=UPI002D4E043C|nr:hypothetical protein [Azospirillum sp.]HYD66162.1 hypothetical protein [Azospirillum sp.]
MAEAVGLLIINAVAAAGVTGPAGFALASTTVVGVGLTTIVGSAAIIGASIGLQYALNGTPGAPRPEDGSQAIRQSIPARQRGYGINRLAGAYMYFEASDSGGPPAQSYDVIAFHSGKIDSLLGMYLSDDSISTIPSVLNGGLSAGEVQGLSDGSYQIPSGGTGHPVLIQIRLGDASQTAMSSIVGWDSTHRGDGIAYAGIICAGIGDPSEHSRIYPRGRPELSVVANCSPIWDPRDGAQSFGDPSTWVTKSNPVLELIDYVTREDGGMGQDLDIVFPPDVLAQWMVEADLCDALVEGAPRYVSDGWFRYDTSPEDVINSILSTCDGWLAEAGDGTLSLTVGVYREPTEPPLTEHDIVGVSLHCGQADEQIINVLNVSFTDPAQKFVSAALDDVRDEISISELGAERPKPLSLTWVQSEAQAERLAGRALQRLNPRRSGTFTTKLIGLRYFGKRWVKVQYPFLADLEDCVVEIQPSPTIDLLTGTVLFSWILVDPAALAEI